MNIEGLKIVKVRSLTKTERETEGWDRNCTCLVLEDGSLIYPSRDSEGNGPGVLFGRKGDETFYLG